VAAKREERERVVVVAAGWLASVSTRATHRSDASGLSSPSLIVKSAEVWFSTLSDDGGVWMRLVDSE
jgi:hypothetical protein